MLFYNFNTLDDFIKNNLISNIKAEKENLNQLKNLYANKKSNLLTITTNMIEITDFMEEHLEDFQEVISSLKKSFENIDTIESLIARLEENLAVDISLYERNFEYNINEIKANLVDYNKQREELFNKILEFENTSTSILNSAIELSFQATSKKKKKHDNSNLYKKDDMIVDIKQEPYDHNVLIVSEKEQKAYLPFFYSKVKEIFESGNTPYMSLQDVINELYVIPLNRFKSSSIARFREAFHLIREKEKGSITKALDLGLELMFKYDLNPIIIAACRNLDELDIYLACMDENELSHFPCFEIKFEVMPQVVKNRKKNTFLF